MTKFIAYLYIGTFSVIALSLTIFVVTYFQQESRISVLSGTYAENCTTTNYRDVTSEISTKCNSLKSCLITYQPDSSENTPHCTPNLKVEWTCHNQDFIQVIYFETKTRAPNTTNIETILQCPGRLFRPSNSI